MLWKLQSNDTEINPLGEPITTSQISLLAGLSPLGGIIGPLFLTRFCDIIGRRKTIIMLSIMMLIGEIVVAFSRYILICYIGRFLSGLAIGAVVGVVPVFITEISEDHNRGRVGCIVGLCFPLGYLYVYLIGPFFSVQNFALLCAVPQIINLICLLLFIPESPIYLVAKGKQKEALKVLKKLRNKSQMEIEKEYVKILRIISENSYEEKASWRSLLAVKSFRRGLLIALGLSVIQPLSGMSAILAFAGSIFDEVGFAVSGDMSAIIIGIVQVLAVVFTTSIIDKAGRRPILLISSLGLSLPHFLLGLFFHLKHYNLVSSITWLPIVCVLLLTIFYAIGLGTIPSLISSELFPSSVRAKTSTLCSFISITCIFLVNSLFPLASGFLGRSYCLWMFSSFCILGFMFIYFLFPEIEGKDLSEVQKLLSR